MISRMKTLFSNKYIILIMALFVAMVWYSIYKEDDEYNTYKCETKKLELKGIINRISNRSNDMKAHIINGNSFFSLGIKRTKYSKGFPDYYSYEVGDSIIKKAGSKEFTIKNGDKIAIYELDCDN